MKKSSRFASSIFALFLFCTPSSLVADELSLKPNHPSSYTVKKGDTLWDISALFLDSPWLWPKLWKLNSYIENPHLIYPGDRLTLSWLDGQPVLSLKPFKKLSPKIRTVEKSPLPTVSPALIVPYLNSDKLIDQFTFEHAFHVLGTHDGRRYLSAQDPVYVDGVLEHERWGIYRVVSEFERRHEQNVAQAYALKQIATAALVTQHDNFSQLAITTLNQEVQVNDLVLPMTHTQPESLTNRFSPSPAPFGLHTSILGSIDGGKYMAINQVVVVDRGSEDGLVQGNMFVLKEPSTAVGGGKGKYAYQTDTNGDSKAIQFPSRRVGELMVIRPYQQFSLALITKSTVPVSQHIMAVSPLTEPMVESSGL